MAESRKEYKYARGAPALSFVNTAPSLSYMSKVGQERRPAAMGTPSFASVASKSTEWRKDPQRTPTTSKTYNDLDGDNLDDNVGKAMSNLTIGPGNDSQQPAGIPKRWAKKDYKIGWIIRAPLHEGFVDDDVSSVGGQSRASKVSTFLSSTKHGPVISKGRPHIIVAKHIHHYVAIPLYTHQGNGLKRFNNDLKKEYVCIHDARRLKASGPPTNPDQIQNGYLIADINAGLDLYKEMSAAHLTHPVARDYRLKVTYEGKLQRAHKEKLLQLVRSKHSFPDEKER